MEGFHLFPCSAIVSTIYFVHHETTHAAFLPFSYTDSSIPLQVYCFVDFEAEAAALTSSSLGRISGVGPTGVILCKHR